MGSTLRRPAILLVALVLAALAALVISSLRGEREISALPDDQRRALYESTLANVRTTCAAATGPTLTDVCHEQAALLLQFPECDDACRELVQRFTHRPTR